MQRFSHETALVMKLLLHASNFCWKQPYPKERALGCKGRAFHLFLLFGSPSMGAYGRSQEKLQPRLHRVCIWS